MSSARADMIEDGAAGESLAPYVAVLKRRRWLLIVVPLVCAAITAAALVIPAREYEAQASFTPQDPQSGGLGGRGGSIAGIASTLGVSGLAGIPSLGGGKDAEFYAALLQSRELLHSLAVTQYHSGTSGFTGDLIAYFKIERPTRHESELWAMDKLKKRVLDVKIDLKAAIIHVSVITKDPDVSVGIARRMLNLLNEFNLQRRQAQAGAEREFTETRSKEALADLDRAEHALEGFDEQNRSVVQSPRLQTQRAGFQRRVEIASQVYLTLIQQYEQARIEAVRNTPLISVIDNPEGLVERVKLNAPAKMALAMMAGLIVTVLWVLVRDRRLLPAARRTAPALLAAD